MLATAVPQTVCMKDRPALAAMENLTREKTAMMEMRPLAIAVPARVGMRERKEKPDQCRRQPSLKLRRAAIHFSKRARKELKNSAAPIPRRIFKKLWEVNWYHALQILTAPPQVLAFARQPIPGPPLMCKQPRVEKPALLRLRFIAWQKLIKIVQCQMALPVQQSVAEATIAVTIVRRLPRARRPLAKCAATRLFAPLLASPWIKKAYQVISF